MKIKKIIEPEYSEIEIHICGDKETKELNLVYDKVKNVLVQSITAYDEDVVKKIPCTDIIHIYTQDKKVWVSSVEGHYRLRLRMYELDEMLDHNIFLRVSSSEIVNLDKILSMDTGITGTIVMNLCGGEQIYVSRRYVTKIKKALGI